MIELASLKNTSFIQNSATPFNIQNSSAVAIQGTFAPYRIVLTNLESTARYVRFYNSSAAPTVAGAAIDRLFLVPASGQVIFDSDKPWFKVAPATNRPWVAVTDNATQASSAYTGTIGVRIDIDYID